MIEKLREFLKNNNINIENQTVVIAVSTGVDSMSLLDCIANLDMNVKIVVAHVNHGKREQSVTEENFIKQYCTENKFKCYITRLDINAYSNHNFQDIAHELRMKFFKEVMEKEKSSYLFLAHHLNDDIETMLMKIIRGSSLKGYSGIDEVIYDDGKYIVRPFLSILKDEIIKYAKEHKITYYEDDSNVKSLYTRNRIRKDVVPALLKEGKAVPNKFREFKETILAASEIVMNECNKFIDKYVTINDKCLSFNKNYFLDCVKFIQINILFELFKVNNFSKANILELIKLISSDKQNLKSSFKGLTFVKEYDEITIFFGKIDDCHVNLEITGLGKYDINDKYYIKVSKKTLKIFPNKNKICYNSNMLPVTIRSRENGDTIEMDFGKKKIKDFLIDRKIGILERQELLLLTKDSEVLAIMGYKIGMKLKNIEDTDIVIELKEK